MIAGLKDGATGIGDRGGLRALTGAFFLQFSEEELGFAEKVDIPIVDPVSINLELMS